MTLMNEENVSGLPDYGTPGNKRCYECCEPVDEITLSKIGHYDDPLAAVLGKCEVCDAPRYEVLGTCPACAGPVYEFKEHFGCYNTFSGNCDFIIPVARMKECELEPFHVNMKKLLRGGLKTLEIQGQEDYCTTHATLVRSTTGAWDITVSAGCKEHS